MKAEKNPKVLLTRFRKGELDVESFSEVLISLIEGSNDQTVRIESLEMLGELNLGDLKTIKLTQSLLISDSDEMMRCTSARIVIEQFLSESHSEVRWALENEPSIDCFTVIIEKLKMKDKELLGRILRDVLKGIIAGKAPGKFGIPKQYYTNLSLLFKRRDIEDFSIDELVEIYLNYRTLLGLENKYDLDANCCEQMIRDGLVESLDLGGIKINNISEIPGLPNFSKLKELDLTQTNLTELSGLEDISELRLINLSWNHISEIKGLNSLRNLMSLHLEENSIKEISGLQDLVNLKELWLVNNKISEIKGLENLRNLEYLTLDSNNITEIEGLQNLVNLRELSLINNQISELKGLNNLNKLKNLFLTSNKLKEIRGLTKLKSLEYLEIEDNNLVKVKELKKLKNLRSVFLFGNDFSENKLREFQKWFEKEVKKRNLKDYKVLISKSPRKLS